MKVKLPYMPEVEFNPVVLVLALSLIMAAFSMHFYFESSLVTLGTQTDETADTLVRYGYYVIWIDRPPEEPREYKSTLDDFIHDLAVYRPTDVYAYRGARCSYFWFRVTGKSVVYRIGFWCLE